jgi:hypothetical protein
LRARPFPATVAQLECLRCPFYSLDLTDKLPLRLGCRAALWDGKVYLYRGRSDCIGIVELKADEQPTPELIVRRIGMAAWQLVSDWQPGSSSGDSLSDGSGGRSR